MQSAKNRLTDHGAHTSRLNRPRIRRILAKPEVRSRPVVVCDVLAQHPPQMPLVEHDHVVEAFPPRRSHHPLDVAVLPRRLVGDDLLFTMVRLRFQSPGNLEIQTHRARSAVLSRGRRAVRRRTSSWWRRARLSRASCRRERNAAASANRKILNIGVSYACRSVSATGARATEFLGGTTNFLAGVASIYCRINTRIKTSSDFIPKIAKQTIAVRVIDSFHSPR